MGQDLKFRSPSVPRRTIYSFFRSDILWAVERHRKEIGTLNDKLGDLKEDIATEDLRKKIQTLQGLLDQSLAPTPRAMLEVGFYDGPQYPLRDEFYESVQGEHVTIKVSILNQSDATAKDVDLWIRICDVCKYAS